MTLLEQRFQDFNKDLDREQRDNQRMQSLSRQVEGLVNVKLESIVKNQMNETVLSALEKGQASYLQKATNLVEQVSYIFFCIFGKSKIEKFCLIPLLMESGSCRIHTLYIK